MDVDADDIALQLLGLSGILRLTAERAPDAWRHHLGIVLDGLRPSLNPQAIRARRPESAGCRIRRMVRRATGKTIDMRGNDADGEAAGSAGVPSRRSGQQIREDLAAARDRIAVLYETLAEQAEGRSEPDAAWHYRAIASGYRTAAVRTRRIAARRRPRGVSSQQRGQSGTGPDTRGGASPSREENSD